MLDKTLCNILGFELASAEGFNDGFGELEGLSVASSARVPETMKPLVRLVHWGLKMRVKYIGICFYTMTR